MAQKFDVISELYDRACLEIITDPVKWQSFLQTAGRNFKLRFDEQFLLFIQRPDATAVLEIERWNETFERWVNKGEKRLAPNVNGGFYVQEWDGNKFIPADNEYVNIKYSAKAEKSDEKLADIADENSSNDKCMDGLNPIRHREPPLSL